MEAFSSVHRRWLNVEFMLMSWRHGSSTPPWVILHVSDPLPFSRPFRQGRTSYLHMHAVFCPGLFCVLYTAICTGFWQHSSGCMIVMPCGSPYVLYVVECSEPDSIEPLVFFHSIRPNPFVDNFESGQGHLLISHVHCDFCAGDSTIFRVVWYHSCGGLISGIAESVLFCLARG